MEKKEIEATIIAMEKAALEQWNNGNPTGYLEIYAQDITYFDPMHETRLNGWEEVKVLYESLRGQAQVESYNMINPTVQIWENTALLTYNLDSYGTNGKIWKWNCTEVYRMEEEGVWKIAHNHWSLVKPMDV